MNWSIKGRLGNGKVRKGLESIVKRYAPLVGISSLKTPLHEGMHALMATILPSIDCSGIVLSDSHWYSKPLEIASFGIFSSEKTAPGIDGYAKIAYTNSFLGNLDAALTTAAPEIATMALGFYWIRGGLNNIKENGSRLYALAGTYCGMYLVKDTFNYLNMSMADEVSGGGDHRQFGESILRMFHLPAEGFSDVATVAGVGMMMTASLYITDFIWNKKHGKLLDNNNFLARKD
jgi:hypothetical protein